jgi:hypothetical protein
MKSLVRFIGGCLRFAVLTSVLGFFVAGYTDTWTSDVWWVAIPIAVFWEVLRPR